MRLRILLLVGLFWAQPYKDLEGHTGPVNAIAFTPDSRYLVSAGSDRQVILWSIPYGSLIGRLSGRKQGRQTLQPPQASVNALALNPQPTTLLFIRSGLPPVTATFMR
jgi:WD40 repeat protein